MYGNLNLTLGTELLRKSVLISFTETVLPIFTSIVITLRLRKESVFTLIMGFAVKTLTFFPLVRYFGAFGIILSTVCASIACMTIYFILLYRRYSISFIPSFRRLFIIIINSALTIIPCFLIRTFVKFAYNSRITCLLILFAFGMIMVYIYYLLNKKTKLFEKIFEIKNPSIKSLIHRFKI